jgi:hypothetical protein
MKRIIYLLPVIIAGCAAPKYTYYFDRVKALTPSQVALESQSSYAKPRLMVSVDSGPVYFSRTGEFETTPVENIEEKTLTKREIRNERKKIRREAITLIKELRSAKNDDSIRSVKADASKNGFAIAGFVSSLVGLLLLWPLCILGIIFSAIGMKSERKGLATAGLIIGIVGVVLVLIAGALLASAL